MTKRAMGWAAMPLVLAGCQAADAVGTGAANSETTEATTPAAEGAAAAGPVTEDQQSPAASESIERITPVPQEEIPRTEAEWQQKLTPEQFNVLRKHGTERAYSGEYARTKARGTYHCAGCGETLFDSETKFDSGTGWPSFYDVIGKVGDHVETQVDRSLFVTRIEVHCKRCGGHLGHVFEDGPDPTGLRYCINSVSLKLGSSSPAPDDADAAPDQSDQAAE